MRYLMSEKTAAFVRGLQRSSGYHGIVNPTRRASSSRGEEDDFPAPYTVRWSASEGESGAWVIWLGDPQEVLFVGGSRVMVEGITAADNLPDGWFTVDELQEGSTGEDGIYLQVSGCTATLTTTYSADAVLIAWLSSDATTGAKSVLQLVVGTMVYGGASAAAAFDLETKTVDGVTGKWVVRCAIAAPEDVRSCSDYGPITEGENVYLVATRSSSQYDISITQTAPSSSDTVASWLLWEYDSNLETYIDRRPKVLPLYAL